MQYVEKYPHIRIFAGDLPYLSRDGTVEQIAKGWDYNLDELLGRRTGMNQPSTFVHREVYEKVGLIDVSIRCAMDYEWLVRAMHHYQCVPIPHALAYFRRRKGSITDAHMAEHFREFLRQRRKYGKPFLSRAEFEFRFYIYTDWLRRIGLLPIVFQAQAVFFQVGFANDLLPEPSAGSVGGVAGCAACGLVQQTLGCRIADWCRYWFCRPLLSAVAVTAMREEVGGPKCKQ